MNIEAIGAASIERSLASTQQAVGISLMKGAMEQHEQQATQLIEAIAQSVPSFGHQLDTYA